MAASLIFSPLLIMVCASSNGKARSYNHGWMINRGVLNGGSATGSWKIINGDQRVVKPAITIS